jgi:hypothetical protein
MKLINQAIILSIVTLAANTHVNCAMDHMDPHVYTKNNFTRTTINCATRVRHWYGSNATSNKHYDENDKRYKFCTNNPIFQWIEGKHEDYTWGNQNLKDFLTKTRDQIWQQNRDRIICFCQLICFLLKQIDGTDCPVDEAWKSCLENNFKIFVSTLQHVKSSNINRKAAKQILNSIFMYDPQRTK